MRTIIVGKFGSPGVAKGKIVIVKGLKDLEKVSEGSIVVIKEPNPVMLTKAALNGANGFVIEYAGRTSHATIISRELGIPCIAGAINATSLLTNGQKVTVNGSKAQIYDEYVSIKHLPFSKKVKLRTETKVKVNLSFPKLAPLIAPLSDGIGFLRLEFIVLSIGEHPVSYIKKGKEAEYSKKIANSLEKIVKPFYPKPVWIRTLDIPTEEYNLLKGAEDEPFESNPMLGWRGIRRDLDDLRLLKLQYLAIKHLVNIGYDNLGIFYPLAQHVDEYVKARRFAERLGIGKEKNLKFGIMVETPACALTIDKFIKKGIDFVIFGTNDLTQLTLGVDRDNPKVSKLFNERHEAVIKLISYVIKKCKKNKIESCIGGQAASEAGFVKRLIKLGISSFSVSPDALLSIRKLIYKEERKLKKKEKY